MALEGNLQDLSLPNVLQIICLERQRVGIMLRRNAESGAIYFEDGEIVHATVGRLVGEEAVYQLLTWTEGNFRTTTDVKIERRTIRSRWDQLLMEGMKRLDELERDRAAQPNKLTTAEVEHDARLENEMLLLMSRLDSLRARLAERQTQKRPVQALQILTLMANQVADLSEAIFGRERTADVLSDALSRATAQHPTAQVLEFASNRLPAEHVTDLYNSAAGRGRAQIYGDVSHTLIGVIEDSFKQLTSCLRSGGTVAELKEAYEYFLQELTHTAEAVKA
ncbi:MAG: DUF4388 domain-containing protein [Pyrinomonadaceae bacterium]|nr:DUF4388 domain-containing protein [Pyrinomonadaceae bacterium]